LTRPGMLDGLPGDRDLPPREGLVNSKLKKLRGANRYIGIEIPMATIRKCRDSSV